MAKTKKILDTTVTQAILPISAKSAAYPYLTYPLFNRLFIDYLLADLRLHNPNLTDLIFITPESATSLRALIRQYALGVPCKIRLLALPNPADFRQVLTTAQPFLRSQFFLFALDNFAGPFQATQLENYAASLIMATDEKENLLHTYLFQKNFLDFLSPLDPALSWPSILSRFALDHSLKSVAFANTLPMPESSLKNSSSSENYWLNFSHQALTELLQESALETVSCPNLSPTTRLLGQNYLDNTVITGENCLIENSYLGKNCRLGNFCHLQNVILQDNVCLGDYVQAQNCYFAPDTILPQNHRSYQNQLMHSFTSDTREK